ncbi:DUF5134 domain-containing protein, partial [Streptomyces sp. NPDC000963]
AMAVPGAPGAHAGHTATGAGGIPVLTGGLLLYYAAYVLRAGTRLVPVAAPAGGAAPTGGAGRRADRAGGPEMTLACRLSMALGMVAMLVTL